MKEASLIALVDSDKGGMILGIDVRKGEDAMTGMLRTIEGIKAQTFGMVTHITFVEPCKSRPATPYVHAPMQHSVNEDDSVNTPDGKLWFKLIMSYAVNEEEE